MPVRERHGQAWDAIHFVSGEGHGIGELWPLWKIELMVKLRCEAFRGVGDIPLF